MENPPDYIPRPGPGMLLHTIRVESHVNGLVANNFEIIEIEDPKFDRKWTLHVSI